MSYCLYLRKSRTDVEAESHGEGETLARHEKALLELAKRLHLSVTEIYREIVSGETIAARPVMQRLLQEVEQGCWEGVLVMEVERLARGDTIDQGIVAQTFKYSDTKIVTPVKVYDPNNEFDEEYFEFGLFMSRREYKTINRRLQRGRRASALEGKFQSPFAPYGYKKVKIPDDKGFTLEPVPDEAEIVKYIFQLYTSGETSPDGSTRCVGVSAIATILRNMKVSPPVLSNEWSGSTVRCILRNPVYAGKIRWKQFSQSKKVVDGSVSVVRRKSAPEDVILAKGLHPAIIPEETFELAQQTLSSHAVPSLIASAELANPLAGIVYCGLCGRSLLRYSKNGTEYVSLRCPNRSCSCAPAKYSLIEQRLLSGIADWLSGYELSFEEPSSVSVSSLDVKKKSLDALRADTKRLNAQLDRTHDLLEQGIYSTDDFLRRSRLLSQNIEKNAQDIDVLTKEIAEEELRSSSRKDIIPKAKRLIEVYDSLSSPAEKNSMLKEVLEKAVYVKESRSRRKADMDDFTLTLYPKLPPRN